MSLTCRSKIERVLEIQKSMENKGIAVFLICLIFGILAFVRLFVDLLLSVYMAFNVQGTESRKFCWTGSSWHFLLLSCTVIILVISL